ncbi:MAG TPA: hypothetical protein VFR32_05755 [Gaiellaceae bacterium]|nr:hypothetical protein [Gaiellaceae bacterium]
MTQDSRRPLGELLVERGAIDQYELDHWLKEQKLSGMLLGELLVQHKIVSPVEVAAALAVQRGADGLAHGIHNGPRQLGRILVEQGQLSESGLQRALLAQRRHGGALGDILVQRGWVTRAQIDEVLAGGPERESAGEPRAAERYEVYEPGAASPMYVSDAFLDATDCAFDLIQDEDPDALEIVEVRGGERSVAWSYVRPAEPA